MTGPAAAPSGVPGSANARAVRLIAFYLPQYHPIPENDAWWGQGFTEWTNVSSATPLFPGHHQPRRPADLGYYDLRVPEIREQQASLARAYGIHGFCYYYYWFGGRRLLERPLDEMLASGRPDLPFCICWANENWTRRWDGDEHDVLVGQEHTPESDGRFIRDVLPILEDERYIRVDGRPLLVVYRGDILPDPVRTTDVWREAASAHGLGDLHLVVAQTFGLQDPRELGFDAAVEFPPHGIKGSRLHDVPGLDPAFTGKIHDYREAVDFGLGRAPEPYWLHRTVMTGWDNTARRGTAAHVWNHATPDAYERWLRGVIASSSRDARDPDPIVFVNAWNEWAEGAHLEPDQRYGHTYLQATRRALLASSPPPRAGVRRDELETADVDALRDRIRILEEELERHQRANDYFRAELEARDAVQSIQVSSFSPEPPAGLASLDAEVSGEMCVEHVGPSDAQGALFVSAGRRMRVTGWAFAEGSLPGAGAALLLRSHARKLDYYAPIAARVRRDDIAKQLADAGAPPEIGFEATIWYEGVEPGLYEIGIVQHGGEAPLLTLSGQRIRVPA